MLKFFRHNYPIQYAVILLATITVWIPVFCNVPDVIPKSSGPTPLYDFLIDSLASTPWIVTTIAFIAFVFSVFYFNSILIINQMSPKNSTLGAFMFLLTMASRPFSSDNYQFIIACPLIIVVMQMIYSLLKTEEPERCLFDAGVFLGLSSIFYYPSILLIVWVLLVLLLYGYRQFRFYLIPFVGLFLPYFFLFAISYFKGNIFEFFDVPPINIQITELKSAFSQSFDDIILGIEILLIIISLIKIRSSEYDHSIYTRKKIEVTSLLLFFAPIMMILQYPFISNGLIFIVFAVIYTMALMPMKKSKIAEILVLLLIIGDLLIQYSSMFL